MKDATKTGPHEPEEFVPTKKKKKNTCRMRLKKREQRKKIVFKTREPVQPGESTTQRDAS